MLRDVVSEFLKAKSAQRLSDAYLADLKYRCGRLQKHLCCPISSVTSEDVRRFLADLKLSPRSHNNFVDALATLFGFAKSRGYLPRDHDELRDLAKIKDLGGKIEVFTPSERFLRQVRLGNDGVKTRWATQSQGQGSELVDTTERVTYPTIVESYATSRENPRGYYTAPWRKARICARFVLNPELIRRARYARIAAALANDPAVTSRLIDQAMAHLRGKQYQRALAT
jgi:hypothetical protein